MRMKKYGMALLMMLFAAGAIDVALAGGGGGQSEMSKKLTDEQVAECAENPEKLISMTLNRNSKVKGDALARVLDRIAQDEGLNSSKIDQVLTLGFDGSLGTALNLVVSMGTSMGDSVIKDQILVKIRDSYGKLMASRFEKASGARYPDADGSDGGQEGEGDDSGDDQGTGQGQQDDTGTGDTGQTGQNNTPPPVQNEQQDDEEEQQETPPPQPPVGQPYAGQQLL